VSRLSIECESFDVSEPYGPLAPVTEIAFFFSQIIIGEQIEGGEIGEACSMCRREK
jgi:hypothetical protein